MLKLLGSFLVVLAAGSVGFGFAAAVRAQAVQLQRLIAALEYMKSEIAFRLTPLPELFRLLGSAQDEPVGSFFARCASELLHEPGAGIQTVFHHALRQTQKLALPQSARRTLLELSVSLGKFDAQGQINALSLASERLRQQLATLEAGRKERCRSYETIGICAGLALAVILL